MEITTELLITIRKRAEYAFFTKTGFELENISLEQDGCVYCSHDGIKVIDEFLTVKDLTSNLDELIEIREVEREKERIIQEDIRRKKRIIFENLQIESRRREYLKLKEEFGETI